MKIKTDQNGSPKDEVLSGRLGPETRYELCITGPYDASHVGRLIQSLEITLSALSGSTSTLAAGK